MPVPTDVEWLLKHIEGLERLLAAYRLGTQPTERTWNMLDKSRPEWLRIKNGGSATGAEIDTSGIVAREY